MFLDANFANLTQITNEESRKAGRQCPMACFQNPIMKKNGSFQVRAEGSTRGRVELRPRAGAVPNPFENTPSFQK
jgi:hypothetical protein